MNWFTGHRLLHEQNGSTVILYLDQYFSEFSSELIPSNKTANFNSIEDNALQYVQKKIPNFNIKQIKIMLGTLPLASISVESIVKENDRNNTFVASQLNSKVYYTVEPEDTISRIASLYNTTVPALKSLNKLTDDRVFPGQKLKLYGQQRPQYIVRPGDSIFNIAGQFNITVNHLKQANAIKDIYIGQTLIIPRQESERIANNLPDRELIMGMEGEHVRRLHNALYLCGYDLDIDGVYGVKTASVVQRFQKACGLEPTGEYNNALKLYIKQNLLGNQRIVTNPEDTLVLVNKVRRLPYSYVPPDLVEPNITSLIKGYDQRKLVRSDVARALELLFESVQVKKIKLYASTGYQSYEVQERKFLTFANSYGIEKANRIIAKPGESEHQTGLAINLTTDSGKEFDQVLENTDEYKHLTNNISQFGFIIRYPKDKEKTTGYQFEPWHLRYVGQKVATVIQQKQITLEEYLGL